MYTDDILNYYSQQKNDELYHHGVLGQKWGIRRFQKYGEGGYVPKGKDIKAVKDTYKTYTKGDRSDKTLKSFLSDKTMSGTNFIQKEIEAKLGNYYDSEYRDETFKKAAMEYRKTKSETAENNLYAVALEGLGFKPTDENINLLRKSKVILWD